MNANTKKAAVLVTISSLAVATVVAGCGTRSIAVENASTSVVDVTISTPSSAGLLQRTGGKTLKCLALAPGNHARVWQTVEAHANWDGEYRIKVVTHESGHVSELSIPSGHAKPRVRLQGTPNEIKIVWINPP